ncbi:hypothetical protein GBA63_22720 (plasmid) [Rubrobacter tropicus]|uniref:TNase-like domain-containing protein n=2 Tax=Rubrobacter tropicus TaxID=2653851 RepID=A0A6G8QG87_9ACTN|nr:hypothetical protein GBA63_22720 [Rubrobacter tropicus]
MAALLACAALLIVHPAQAFAEGASDRQQEEQDGGRPGGGGNSGGAGSGNALGVIVDIPEGWPLNDKGGGHDIVRFEKCFPFCHVKRPDGDSQQESTVREGGTNEQTTIIEQTQIQGETQTDEDGGTDDGNEGGGTDQYETDQGNGGGNSGEEEPQEPTVSEETTVLEDTTTSEGTTNLPPGGTAKCPTGPSGPISDVTLSQVLDADTLQVKGSDGNAYTIRLIGAEAPDLAGAGAEGGEDEPGAEEAAAFAREALGGAGRKLQLEYDEQKTDENGQTFAYVWTENAGQSPKPKTAQELVDTPGVDGPVLYNRTLVEAGYARAATAEPNTDYAGCLKQAENAARADGAGLWEEQASSPGPSGPDDPGAAAAPAASRRGTAGAISVELVSRKTPLSKSRAEAGAKAGDSAIPPITRRVDPPDSAAARDARPALALALGLVAASLAAAIVFTRGVGRTGARPESVPRRSATRCTPPAWR